MSFRFILFLSLTSFLLLSTLSHSLSSPEISHDITNEDDEDLSFLEEPKESTSNTAVHGDHDEDPDLEDDGDSEDGGEFSDFGNSDSDSHTSPEIDEKDVVVLKEKNFTDVIENNKFVMVEFYAPWCGHCQALAPEYAAAATALKSEGVVLAKVDATEENELGHQYDVQGFPTVYFFIDGEHKPYNGARTKDAIVTWIKKKTGPGVYNITALDDAEGVLTSGNIVVLGYLNSLVGAESDQLAAASRAEDDVNFYQTVNPDVAKLFHIDPEAKRPTLVLLKKEEEKISHFDGQYVKSAIVEFVSANKLPLVTLFTRESSAAIFESPIEKQLLLFASKNESEKVISEFQEAAKSFKGKVIFVYVDLDDEEDGKPVAYYFGVTGVAPKLIAFDRVGEGKKYFHDGELKSDKIKAFGADFLAGKLKPFYKTERTPEKNDGDVKIVVGENFDAIVLDESKDVLLEIYAPWCGHCQSLEPTYNKLAKYLSDIDSIVVAKMDGTANEHPRAKVEGFPTILFYPAGKKSSDPVTVDVDRTVVALYKFLRKHAGIPFKLQKPTSTPEADAASESKLEGKPADLKDEL